MGTDVATQRMRPAVLGPAQCTAGAEVKWSPSARQARADGYDQLLVDVMQSASVAFGIALANGSSRCEIQPMSRKSPQRLSKGLLRAQEGLRWRG